MIPSPPPGRMLSPKALMADPGTKIRGGRARGSSRPSLASPISPGVALCFSSQSPSTDIQATSLCQEARHPRGAPAGGGGASVLLHRLSAHLKVNHTHPGQVKLSAHLW